MPQTVAPIAAPDQIIVVLADYRGDVWMMDLSVGTRHARRIS
jgi:hypothetical protein